MAYNEQFLAFGKESVFKTDLANGNIKPTSVAFVEESGKEGIHTQGKSYQTIPSNGRDGQVLMSSDGKGVWMDLDVLDVLSYGVSWKPNVADPVLTRVGNMNYHKALPIQSGMKGCVYNPKEKKVVYWLDENDWTHRKEPSNFNINVVNQGDFTIVQIVGLQNLNTQLGYGTYLHIRESEYIGIVQRTEANGMIHVKWNASNEEMEEYFISEGSQSGNFADDTFVEIGSNLAGYDGEVMVYVPEFYIKSWDEPERREVRISPTKIDETWEHQPAVYLAAYRDTVLNTVPEDMGYLSTLEANTAVSVANDQPYCRGGNNDATNDEMRDVFRRQLGKCRTNISRTTFRTYARKVNKEIMSYRQYKNIMYWLWVIEYANFNCQATYNPELTAEGFRQGGMGPGFTGMVTWSEYNNYYPIVPNGYTNEFGNGTGKKTIIIPEFSYGLGATNSQTRESVRWRGLEDPFGHIWHNVDGIIIDADADNHPNNMNYVYTTDDPSKYGDTLADIANMVLSGLEIHTDGYTKEWDLGSTAEIIPRLMGGNTTQYKCDYHWTGTKSTTLRTLLLGGSADNGGLAGLGYFYSCVGVAYSSASVGFRTSCVAN